MQVSMLRNMVNLTHVKRWAIVPMTRQESVAEHSFRVAAIAEWLADAIEDHEDGPKFDRLVLLRIAMRHDIDECFSGDIPTPCKPFVDSASISKRASKGILLEAAAWEKETTIVKLADMIDSLWSLKLFGIQPYADAIGGKIGRAVREKAENAGLHYIIHVEQALQYLTDRTTLIPDWMK